MLIDQLVFCANWAGLKYVRKQREKGANYHFKIHPLLGTTMWQRLGRVYEGLSIPGFTRTQCPVVVKEHGQNRLLFTSRSSSNASHVLSCDFHINERGGFSVSEEHLAPVLAPGSLGTFDEDGAMASCIVRDDQSGILYLYYTGWNKGVHVPFKNLIGVAKSSLETG